MWSRECAFKGLVWRLKSITFANNLVKPYVKLLFNQLSVINLAIYAKVCKLSAIFLHRQSEMFCLSSDSSKIKCKYTNVCELNAIRLYILFFLFFFLHRPCKNVFVWIWAFYPSRLKNFLQCFINEFRLIKKIFKYATVCNVKCFVVMRIWDFSHQVFMRIRAFSHQRKTYFFLHRQCKISCLHTNSTFFLSSADSLKRTVPSFSKTQIDKCEANHTVRSISPFPSYRECHCEKKLDTGRGNQWFFWRSGWSKYLITILQNLVWK